jgi:futalosine hydrolase
MSYLLVSATAKEISPYLSQYRKARLPVSYPDVLVTGIGLTATAYHLSRQISLKKPALIIQAGIAGCFDRTIPLGSVFVVKQDIVADEGVFENGQLRPFNKKWLINPAAQILQRTRLKPVRAISVNQVSTSKKMTGQYVSLFKPVLESMEGAALHFVCLKENIPFLQLRSVSNYIAVRNKKNWKINEAIINLNNELARLLDIL